MDEAAKRAMEFQELFFAQASATISSTTVATTHFPTNFTSDCSNCTLSSGNSSQNGLQPYSIDPLYEVPGGLIALLSFFYGSISFLAVVGNSLVMWIVATSRRMQNVTNCFIANLALADIVIGLFAIPFQFQAALLQRWNLPNFMCPFCPFVQALSVNVSVFTLTAIAVDRHRAILNPLSARPSKKIAKIIIACIWLVAALLATPMVVALRVAIVEDTDPVTQQVYTKPFCDVANMSDESWVVYRTVLFFLQYLTPLCVISFVYARMAWRLWGSRAPGNAQDSRDANLMKNKKKVIKMLVIVVALFALCWLPLQTYQFLQTCYPLINEYRYINIIFFCSDWLAMSNSCYNPFIYGIYNEKFKREFKQRFPCGRNNWNHALPTDSYDMDKNHSIVHTRHSSVRSNYDWRRSTRHHHHHPHHGVAAAYQFPATTPNCRQQQQQQFACRRTPAALAASRCRQDAAEAYKMADLGGVAAPNGDCDRNGGGGGAALLRKIEAIDEYCA